MRHKLTFSLFVAIFCFANLDAQPTAGLPAFLRDSLDTYVNRALKDWNIPGVAVGVVKDGKLVVAKGYGVLETGKPAKVDANTLFAIGSNTKAFTGTALAMLESDGKCKLDDPVVKYLPNFQMKDDWVAKHLNLQDIVSHRIGMETFQGDFMYWTSDLTQDQCIEKFGKLTPVYPFRTTYGYCNLGFVLAGKCIQQMSGKTWEDNLRERIFRPLKMNRTLALSAEIGTATNAARAHTLHPATGKLMLIPYGQIDNLAPAGSIFSSVEDMSHWLIAQLDSGRYEGNRVIPMGVITRTRQPLSIQGRRQTTTYGIKRHYGLYAMGWGLGDYDGWEEVSHTGGVNGFVTSVTLFPEHKLGIVVLTNTDANSFYVALKREIVDAYLGLPYRNYSNIFLQDFKAGSAEQMQYIQQMRDSIAQQPKTTLALEKYAGHYENEAYGNLDMKMDGNGLKLIFQHHPNLIGKLEPLGGNRFLLSFNDPLFGIKPVAFNVENGAVKNFILQVADFVEFTSYEFVRKG
ncbi:MAG: serine hydrolase [Saprospiraceae bacterium]|nr:serine hydrolase [Saprospiraceae bacterium]